MLNKEVSTPRTRKQSRFLWFGALVTARMIVFVATISIVIGAPVVVFLLLDHAGWTEGFWPGLFAGLVLAFAVWWAYLILYD
ncbi:MAG: hypothetical protein ACR2RF_26390 [Geminicoccaceae bacterium]